MFPDIVRWLTLTPRFNRQVPVAAWRVANIPSSLAVPVTVPALIVFAEARVDDQVPEMMSALPDALACDSVSVRSPLCDLSVSPPTQTPDSDSVEGPVGM
jgi:hypothetical protein